MGLGLNKYEVELTVLTKITYMVEAYYEDEAYDEAVKQAEQFGDTVELDYGYCINLIESGE